MDNQAKKEFTITRVFNASREQVWSIWTNPEMVMQWWGPEGFTSPDCQIDLRAGGKYFYTMTSPDGRNMYTAGTFGEVIPMEKIVYTDYMADAQGNFVNPTDMGMTGFPAKLLITLTLEDLGNNQTKLSLTYDDVSAVNPEVLQGMAAGWNGAFSKIEKLF